MDLQPLDARTGPHLEWREREPFGRDYELRCAHRVFANMVLSAAKGSPASVRTASSEWTFERAGFPVKRVVVRERGANHVTALFRPLVPGKGTLLHRGGARHRWGAGAPWRRTSGFRDESGAELVKFALGVPAQSLTDLVKIQATVTVTSASDPPGALPLLCCLGFYLLIPERGASLHPAW